MMKSYYILYGLFAQEGMQCLLQEAVPGGTGATTVKKDIRRKYLISTEIKACPGDLKGSLLICCAWMNDVLVKTVRGFAVVSVTD